MAGKYTIGYWFKKDKREELTKGKKMYECAEDIGITRETLISIVNNKKCVKHKAMAYAITKYTNKNYEIEDVFDVKNI